MSVADGFLELAAELHRDDPWWIAEDLAEGFGAQTFCVPGQARVSVNRPTGLMIDGAPAAFFGHFESAGDARAETLVFAAARRWARDAGAARLYGPVDRSPALGHCLRLDAAVPRHLGEPYNPPHYADALRALGLREYRRYAGVIVAGAELPQPPLAPGYRLEPLTPALWDERCEEARVVANAAFARNFGFTPLSRTEFDGAFGAAWARRLDPGLSVVAIAPDDRLAAFGPYMPDYVPLLTRGAKLRELSFADAPADCVAVSGPGAVSPVHQRLGLAGAMLGWVARRATSPLFFNRVFTDNPALRLFREGATERRAYALFVTELAR